ncbi:acetyl-CoA carboxylase biotin carboxyl carrier protein [Clostridium sediminicola]|uniref:acetyl-CoA carboxylase biotin carboxyl carrier protein n=1 Tax=Clostridium sediminicola TaxID=3114879 RepID=UPI0031F2089E
MEYKNIEKLIKIMSESDLTELEIDSDDIKIKMKKEKERVPVMEVAEETRMVSNVVVQQPEVSVADVQEDTLSQPVVTKDDGLEKVKSPIVGTFYESPSPDADAYVSVGSKVKKGEVICIVEAMKLMNEIEAEFDLEIVEILIENEGMVEYGEPLFKVKRL